jgi:hypothetical protein
LKPSFAVTRRPGSLEFDRCNKAIKELKAKLAAKPVTIPPPPPYPDKAK